MTRERRVIEKRLRVSGILILAGLIVELVTFFWFHPTAFLFFLLLGGSLLFAGILLYLFTLLSKNEIAPEREEIKAESKA